MAAFLGVIKNQYFCRRNLRAAARAMVHAVFRRTEQ